MKILLFFLIVLFSPIDVVISSSDTSSTGIQTVHVFGDSHSRFSFMNIPGCAIHWLGPRTMHRVGRDGLALVNVAHYGVQENDTAIFVFGEIDVRCHVAKQCEEGRSVEHVISTLVEKYIDTICKNRALYQRLHCIVCAVLPPSDAAFNPEYPYRGSLRERAIFTEKLNHELHLQCKAHGIYVLDVTDYYKTVDGYLNHHLSDGNVHIGIGSNGYVREKLEALLHEIYAHF